MAQQINEGEKYLSCPACKKDISFWYVSDCVGVKEKDKENAEAWKRAKLWDEGFFVCPHCKEMIYRKVIGRHSGGAPIWTPEHYTK